MNTEIDETELKKRFAAELLKNPSEPFIAACAVFGDDTGKALNASARWPRDPEVVAYMAQAVDVNGEMAYLPSKAALARAAWDLSNNEKICVEDRLKAMRLYADVRGFIERQGTTINNNVLTSNKVLLVKDHGADADWEQRLLEQQTNLRQSGASLIDATPTQH